MIKFCTALLTSFIVNEPITEAFTISTKLSDTLPRISKENIHRRKSGHQSLLISPEVLEDISYISRNNNDNVASQPINRRTIIASLLATTSTVPFITAASPANAEPPAVTATLPLPNSVSDLENGVLESRVTENLMSSPTYGMEIEDIFYPAFFNGVWTVTSTTTSILAPCGNTLFGGNATFNNAQNEIGTSLVYRSRFIPSPFPSSPNSVTTIADRDFNVREIAKAAMGSMSVIDIPYASPNKLSCLLAPEGAGKMFNVDLIAVARRQETVDPEREFHCAEVVRQILSTPRGDGKVVTAPVLKEVETASLYTAVPGDGGVKEIKCRQRSATFLLPSQTDQIAYEKWRMARGRPIDVRFYDVVYKKTS